EAVYTVLDASPLGLAACDVDRDGHCDLAFVTGSGGGIQILLGTGDGAFAAPVIYAEDYMCSYVYSRDLDKDGYDDIAATVFEPDGVLVLLNNSDGTFAGATRYDGGGGGPAHFGDFDGDGVGDLVVANGISRTVSVLLNNGDGMFGSPLSYNAGGRVEWVFSWDFDGDDDNDILTSFQHKYFTILYNRLND
ncbi:MAG: VCBS repeat-containing protein, partial [bacterium]